MRYTDKTLSALPLEDLLEEAFHVGRALGGSNPDLVALSFRSYGDGVRRVDYLPHVAGSETVTPDVDGATDFRTALIDLVRELYRTAQERSLAIPRRPRRRRGSP